jgi:hypothetical protein
MTSRAASLGLPILSFLTVFMVISGLRLSPFDDRPIEPEQRKIPQGVIDTVKGDVLAIEVLGRKSATLETKDGDSNEWKFIWNERKPTVIDIDRVRELASVGHHVAVIYYVEDGENIVLDILPASGGN